MYNFRGKIRNNQNFQVNITNINNLYNRSEYEQFDFLTNNSLPN